MKIRPPRSRADEARRREAESTTSSAAATPPAPIRVPMSPVTSARTFNYRRNRAATIERDMEVTVTLTESPATSVEPTTTSWRSRIYGEVSRESTRNRFYESPFRPKIFRTIFYTNRLDQISYKKTKYIYQIITGKY
jgi:hypothetical protein